MNNQILDLILEKEHRTYFEPFLTDGQLFFQLAPKKAVLSMPDPDLCNVYKEIQQNPDEVIHYLNRYKHAYSKGAGYFTNTRWLNLDLGLLDLSDKAARTIYVQNLFALDEDKIREASSALKQARIEEQDVISLLDNKAESGDVIVLDPPAQTDHKELTKLAHQLQQRGCTLFVLYPNKPQVYRLYGDQQILSLGKEVVVVMEGKVEEKIDLREVKFLNETMGRKGKSELCEDFTLSVTGKAKLTSL